MFAHDPDLQWARTPLQASLHARPPPLPEPHWADGRQVWSTAGRHRSLPRRPGAGGSVFPAPGESWAVGSSTKGRS